MQGHITRSRSNKILGGVCGGLADYFLIEPVIVRLIVVLFTITNLVGIPAYLLFWVIVPREKPSRTPLQGGTSAPHLHTEQDTHVMMSPPSHQIQQRTAEPGAEHAGVPPADAAVTGETINLGSQDSNVVAPPQSEHDIVQTPPYRQRWRNLAFVTIGLGVLIALERMGLTMNIMLPALFIIAGIILLRRSA